MERPSKKPRASDIDSMILALRPRWRASALPDLEEISYKLQLHDVTIEKLVSMNTDEKLNQCGLLTGVSIEKMSFLVGSAGFANLHLCGDGIQEATSVSSETLKNNQGQTREVHVAKPMLHQLSLDIQFTEQQQETMKTNRKLANHCPRQRAPPASNKKCAPGCVYLKTRLLTTEEIRKYIKSTEDYNQFFKDRLCYMFLMQFEWGSRKKGIKKGEEGRMWCYIAPPRGKAYLKNSVGDEKFVALDREEKLFAACGNVQRKEYVWNFGVKTKEDGTFDYTDEFKEAHAEVIE